MVQFRLICLSFPVLLAIACGAEAADPSAIEGRSSNGEQIEVVGEITAKLNGKVITWHAIATPEDVTHSAVWLKFEDRNIATIGGYESLDLAFSKPTQGMPEVSGPGSMLAISFLFDETDSQVSLSLPDDSPATVLYMPRLGDYASARTFTAGQLQVNKISISANGDTHFAGTFNGTFSSDIASAEMTLTEGKFVITHARRVERPER